MVFQVLECAFVFAKLSVLEFGRVNYGERDLHCTAFLLEGEIDVWSGFVCVSSHKTLLGSTWMLILIQDLYNLMMPTTSLQLASQVQPCSGKLESPGSVVNSTTTRDKKKRDGMEPWDEESFGLRWYLYFASLLEISCTYNKSIIQGTAASQEVWAGYKGKKLSGPCSS